MSRQIREMKVNILEKNCVVGEARAIRNTSSINDYIILFDEKGNVQAEYDLEGKTSGKRIKVSNGRRNVKIECDNWIKWFGKVMYKRFHGDKRHQTYIAIQNPKGDEWFYFNRKKIWFDKDGPYMKKLKSERISQRYQK